MAAYEERQGLFVKVGSLQGHGITFGTATSGSGMGNTKNTYDDWFLIPTIRPAVAEAQPKTTFVEKPGAKTGPTDMTESLTGDVLYEQRTGSFDFYFEDGHAYWESIRSQIANYLHGKRMRMRLDDEPAYYYEGRFSLSEWRSESWYGKVTINYVLDPYRYSMSGGATSL